MRGDFTKRWTHTLLVWHGNNNYTTVTHSQSCAVYNKKLSSGPNTFISCLWFCPTCGNAHSISTPKTTSGNQEKPSWETTDTPLKLAILVAKVTTTSASTVLGHIWVIAYWMPTSLLIHNERQFVSRFISSSYISYGLQELKNHFVSPLNYWKSRRFQTHNHNTTLTLQCNTSNPSKQYIILQTYAFYVKVHP